MLTMLIAYDAAGNVVATLDHLVAKDADGKVVGLIDFEAHEQAGGKLRDIWDVEGATGSATWPEWIGAAAHDFTVELDADQRISALVHRRSGVKRKRVALEAAAQAVEPDEAGARDIRHLVGGPGAPLLLDDRGRSIPQESRRPSGGTPDHLPVLRT